MGKIGSKSWHFYPLFVLLYVAFLFWLPDSGYDKYFWISWTKDIATNGLGNIYLNPEVNNHPMVLYLLQLLSFIVDGENIDKESVNYLKALVMLFDFATLVLILELLRQTGKSYGWILVVLLNPAFWYNTIVWGQVDTVFTFFTLLSVLLALFHRPVWSLIAIALAVNTKLQAVIFLFPVLMLNWQQLRHHRNWLKAIIAVILLQFLILAPFIVAGNFGETIEGISHSSLGWYTSVSRNAYNVWYLLFDDPFSLSDRQDFLGIPLVGWGLLMFMILYSLIGIQFIILKKRWQSMKSYFTAEMLSVVMLLLALISVIFFYFNTEMHERYIHPAIVFFSIYAIFSQRWMVLILCSIAYLINLEAVMRMLRYYDQTIFGRAIDYDGLFIFQPELVSLLYFAVLLLGFIDLYRRMQVFHAPETPIESP